MALLEFLIGLAIVMGLLMFSPLLAALFTAAGIPVKARIIQLPGVKGWAPIYPVAFVDGAWRAFDATERWPAGWEFRNATRRLDLELL